VLKGMPKVLYCNALETTHRREVFLLTFRFVAPDGKEETVYIAIPPAGASTLYEILGKELESYIKEFGNIVVENWKTEKGDCKEGNDNNHYVS
jgi:hypothetical protein